MVASDLSPGDKWPHHYRGLSLQISPNGDVWWQLYQGSDRLHLEPKPTEIVNNLLEYKRIGGRVHITEAGAVLTRIEDSKDRYKQLYLGEATINGTLTPPNNPEYSINIRPEGLSSGDLWPSIYDGSRYSFVENRIWWNNGFTHRRHPIITDLPPKIMKELRSYKPSGGSFRITPWGDVITLVDMHPAPETVEKQFSNLPRVVKNIIRLRKDRDVEMLPVYIGTIEDVEIEVKEPKTLTDELNEEEMDELSSWAKGLGRTKETTSSAHEASEAKATDHLSTASQSNSTLTNTEAEEQDEDRPQSFDDDPLAWIESEVQPDRDQQ